MRKGFAAFVAGLGMLCAGAAQAAPVAYDYTATLTVSFAALTPVASGPVAGTTNVDDVTGAFTLPAGTFPFATTQTLTPPVTLGTAFGFPLFLHQIGLTGNNQVANLNTAGNGTMSITGQAVLGITVLGIPISNAVPLTGGFGINNTLTGVVLLTGFPVIPTAAIIGQSFVTGVVQAVTTTASGTGPTTISMTGSAPSVTGGGAISMSLVTATQVITDTDGGQDGPFRFTAAFGRLDISLTPVPAPATLVLLGAGLVGLLVLGTRRSGS